MIKKQKKILLISYCLPPDPYPESYVTAKIISKLTNFFEIDILTSTQKKNTLTKDYSLDSYFNKKVNITTIFPSKITDFFLSLSRFPLRPDRWILMYMKMIKKLDSMKLDRYDYFFTRSQFHSSHLIGLYLKKKFPKKKWITSFSDPWSNNKYQRKIPLLDLISKALENEVKKKSDLLIFPLNKLKENFIENSNKIENKKTLIIPHTIDESLYLNKIKKNKKFTIRFFGKIYGDRNIIPFVNALRIILKENKNIIVEFYTRKDPIFEYLAKDKFLKRYLKFKPYEGYLKALNIMENSDLLLIFDSDISKNSIFFQSKVLDYIGSKSRILHIGNYNTINKKLAIESNGLEAKNELNSILNKLKLAIKEKQDFRFNSDLLSQYDSKKIANKLYKRIIRLD